MSSEVNDLMFAKPGKKKRKYKSVRNKIIPGAKCVICGNPAITHECFYGDEYMKEMSKQQGLVIHLCNRPHHIQSKDAIHENESMRHVVQVKAQMQWMLRENATEDDFRRIFKKSYMFYEASARNSPWWDKINFKIKEKRLK